MKIEERLPSPGGMTGRDFTEACAQAVSPCEFYTHDGEIWVALCSIHRWEWDQRLAMIQNDEGWADLVEPEMIPTIRSEGWG